MEPGHPPKKRLGERGTGQMGLGRSGQRGRKRKRGKQKGKGVEEREETVLKLAAAAQG